MGALHEGHISLVAQAAALCQEVVVSIFVNPRQFNNADDLFKYPRQLVQDLKILENSGATAVFIPNSDQIYASEAQIQLDLGNLNGVFEGEFRPGHFQGVADVVHSFFSIVKPNHVFFGLKDLQQCMVIEKLIATHFPSIIQHNCPTLRETSGLAKSSRNQRLSKEGLEHAAAIYRELTRIANSGPEIDSEIQHSIRMLLTDAIETEYLALLNLPSFELSTHRNPHHRQALVFAGYLEGVRLIDNLLLPLAE